ncbi:UNVERIFIED_CONTAM: hypothetical protein GTU68_044820 [Idotea baltica]|nr:hypothetical protein [Idotea baltica]MCL4122679.1 hypothetical protein [Idotea baltica]
MNDSSSFVKMAENSLIFSPEPEKRVRTEMDFYYSFFKTIVESDSFFSGLNNLIYDNRTEYPNTINALQRFNLYPEVILGGSFRFFASFCSSLNIFHSQASNSNFSLNVISYESIGNPVYWYLSGMWLCAGVTILLLFISGIQLSKSVAGGFITVSCFFLSHCETSQLHWMPPLREGFALPLSLALNITITYSVRRLRVSWLQCFIFASIALNYLLCWRLAQYILFANIVIFYALYLVGPSEPLPLEMLLLGSLYALVNALIIQFGSPMTLSSPLTLLFIVVLLHFIMFKPLATKLPTINLHPLFLGVFFLPFLSNRTEQSHIFPADDFHLQNLFKAKIFGYSDFHTRLYCCSKELDLFSQGTFKYLERFVGPNLIVLYVLMRAMLLADIGLCYNMLLLAFYGLMTGPVMRLNLLLVPQLCTIASLFSSKHIWERIKRKEIHLMILATVVSAKSFQGVLNIAEQHTQMMEPNKPHLQELLLWVHSETPPKSAFAGSMHTMASVHLFTQRPIVNHPHFGSASHSQRTKAVYALFSRRRPEELHQTMLDLDVDYVILDESLCLYNNEDCSVVDLWDAEEPQNAYRPLLCPQLFHHDPSPFLKVFANEGYVVLKVQPK